MLKALMLPYDHNIANVEDAEQENQKHYRRNHHKTPITLHGKGDNRNPDAYHRGRDQQEQAERYYCLWTQYQQSCPNLIKGLRKKLELLRRELIGLQELQE